MVATALLGAGEHALIASPNYATNLETPNALGAEVEPIELRFDDGWELDLDRIASALRPETRLVSLTYPHNPTGAMIDRVELERVVGDRRAPWGRPLLVDETYRELAYGEPLPMAASLAQRAISVSSMSKTYGLPGLRIGWLACRDPELGEVLLAAKEQILICGSALDEEMARRVLAERERILPGIREKVAAPPRDRPRLDRGPGGVRVGRAARRGGLLPARPSGALDHDRFYDSLLREHGTYVGPGHWFGEDRGSFRVGFAWPATEELERGLAGLLAAAADAG